MLFNSLTFLIFFLAVYILYKLSRGHLRWQNILLFVASYIFYGWWDSRFLFLITFSTVVDFNCGLAIDRPKFDSWIRIKSFALILSTGVLFLLLSLFPKAKASPDVSAFAVNYQFVPFVVAAVAYFALLYILEKLSRSWDQNLRRKTFLIVSIVTDLSTIAVFKYYNFFAESFVALCNSFFGAGMEFHFVSIILPIGISFHIFQTLSYTVDVYRKELKATDRLFVYATYLSFFPQLLAGPIQRGKHLLPQFLKDRPVISKEERQNALWLIVWGLYKKVVVADSMARIVNATFMPFDHGTFTLPQDGFRLLVGVYAFAFQIYGDFSGYTDMARGIAKLLGFDLTLNFNLPYFARTPSDFWKRWHITLSSWLRDYLYIPLGGNRKGPLLTYCNLMLTMLLGGLWHGASWTFVLWGAFHGLILCVYRFFNISEDKKYLSWGIPFLQGIVMFHLTCLGWLIFRARNIETVGIFLKAIFTRFHASDLAWQNFSEFLQFSSGLIVFQIVQKLTGDLDPLKKQHWFIKLTVYAFLTMSILCFGSAKAQEFIYFAF